MYSSAQIFFCINPRNVMRPGKGFKFPSDPRKAFFFQKKEHPHFHPYITGSALYGFANETVCDICQFFHHLLIQKSLENPLVCNAYMCDAQINAFFVPQVKNADFFACFILSTVMLHSGSGGVYICHTWVNTLTKSAFNATT